MNSLFLTIFLAILLSSIASGIMGTFVVVKKISFLSGSVAHSILGGIGIALYLQYLGIKGADPLLGALLAALLSAWIISYVHLRFRQKEDAIIAAVWSTGMAIGVLFLSFIPGFKGYFTHYLFGNLLLVSETHLFFLALFDLLLLSLVVVYYKKFTLLSFDEESAFLQDISLRKMTFLLLSLISLATVLLIQIIGVILVIALLTIPSTIALLFISRLPQVLLFSILLCFFFHVLGSFLSFTFDWPPGATIALVAAITYFIALLFKKRMVKGAS